MLVFGLAMPNQRPQKRLPSATCSKSDSFCSQVRRELALKTSWTGGSDAPVISMKSLAPDVPQLDKGLSFSQHIESVNPASLVQSVGPLDVNGT